MLDETQKQWCKLHEESRFLPKYPAEAVVRFAFAHALRPSAEYKLLVWDLGCGGGRHTAFFAREGYRAFGSDFSAPALDAARQLLVRESLQAGLCLANAKYTPFADCVFDAVVAYGSLYYLKMTDMAHAIKEIHRVLKPGGHCFVLTRTDSDYRYGKGAKIDEKSYLLTLKETNESGMVNCFLGVEDIPVLFADFANITLERYEFTAENGGILNSDWAITAAKGV